MNKKDMIYDIIVYDPLERVISATETEELTKTDKIGWKGAYFIKKGKNGVVWAWPVLVKLRIPYTSFRTKYSEPNWERYAKHRCSSAKVLGFYSYYTGKELKKPLSSYSNGISNIDAAYSFFTDEPIYKKGETVIPDEYDTHIFVCSTGIHYFYEKESALIYLDWQFSKQYNLRKNCYHIWRKG